MTPTQAMKLLGEFSYRPGWKFRAYNCTTLEESIELRIQFPAPQSDVAYAPFYKMEFEPEVSYILHVGDCVTELDFATKVFNAIRETETHEAREFFAVGGTVYAKPFHPHTNAGMYNWTNRRPVIQADDANSLVFIFGDTPKNDN